MRRPLVLVSLLAGLLTGCVSAQEYRVLADKYAHTLAVKNEIDQEYGAVRKQLVALEQTHGKLSAAVGDHQQQNSVVHLQLQGELVSVKLAQQKLEQALRDLHAGVTQLKAGIEQEAAETRRGITDLRAKTDQVQTELKLRLDWMQSQVKGLDGKVGKLTHKVKTLNTPSPGEPGPEGEEKAVGKGPKPGKDVAAPGPVPATPTEKSEGPPPVLPPPPLMDLKAPAGNGR